MQFESVIKKKKKKEGMELKFTTYYQPKQARLYFSGNNW